MWVVLIGEYLTGLSLNSLGLYPRTFQGLLGIFTMPFLHADMEHLTSNSGTYLILSATTNYFFAKKTLLIHTLIWIGSGLLAWFFARQNYHIGASGLIYGLVSCLFFFGFRKRDNTIVAISLLIAIFYGGIVWGVLPIEGKISWEVHLAGALIGVIASFIFAKDGPVNNQTIDLTNVQDFTNGYYDPKAWTPPSNRTIDKQIDE